MDGEIDDFIRAFLSQSKESGGSGKSNSKAKTKNEVKS
jgi:hypothetical protein